MGKVPGASVDGMKQREKVDQVQFCLSLYRSQQAPHSDIEASLDSLTLPSRNKLSYWAFSKGLAHSVLSMLKFFKFFKFRSVCHFATS